MSATSFRKDRVNEGEFLNRWFRYSSSLPRQFSADVPEGWLDGDHGAAGAARRFSICARSHPIASGSAARSAFQSASGSTSVSVRVAFDSLLIMFES